MTLYKRRLYARAAVVWLWRIVRAPHSYGTDGAPENETLLRRARTDKDFAAIRASAEYRAFRKCLR